MLRVVVLLALAALACAGQVEGAVIHVKTDGWDANDGLTWATAKRSVQAGINAAEPLDEVWVAAGTYVECIVLKSCVAVYGGFVGNETARAQRDWRSNLTVLDGNQRGSTVECIPGAPANTRIDGFVIRNGKDSGVRCFFSSPTISNNTIMASSRGIECWDSDAVISDNVISGNSLHGVDVGPAGAGAVVTISRNTITGNTRGIAIRGGFANIANNRIEGNNVVSGADGGGGIDYSMGPGPEPLGLLLIANNVITGNTGVRGGGVFLSSVGGPLIMLANNSISDNAATEGGGIYLVAQREVTMANNIVAFNSSGVHRTGLERSPPTLRNNCVFGNTQDYYGVDPGAGDISRDPEFVSRETGDYHLRVTSPCINSGSNYDVGSGWLDMDGEVRILPDGGTVDIGADEYSAQAAWAPGEAKKLASDGSPVVITARGPMVATARLDELPAFYVQQSDRSAGIQCRGSELLEPGQAAVLQGIMGTIGWERVLTEAAVIPGSLSNRTVPGPLALKSRSLGGGPFGLQAGIAGASGLNNIGLLVKTSGKVTYAEAGFFYIDDGSGLADGSGHLGVKVYGTVPVGEGEDPVGRLVAVTGISSCEKIGENIVRVIRTRGTEDVEMLD